MRRGRIVLSFVVLGLLGSMLTAGVVSAKVIEHEHFQDTTSEVISGFCGDLTVRETFDISGMALVSAKGRDGLVYFKEGSRGTVTWTNLANNKTMYVAFTANNKDLKVTDNGDGTLTILGMSTGSATLYGPDGRLFRDIGQFRFEVLIDHSGTPTDPSDDVELEFLGVVKSTGINETVGRDFCADIHEFIG